MIRIKESEDGCYPKEINRIILTSSLLFSVDHMVTTILLFNRFYPFLTMSVAHFRLLLLASWDGPFQRLINLSYYNQNIKEVSFFYLFLFFFCLGMKRNLRKIEHTMYLLLSILPPTLYKVQKKLNSIHAEMIVAKNIET